MLTLFVPCASVHRDTIYTRQPFQILRKLRLVLLLLMCCLSNWAWAQVEVSAIPSQFSVGARVKVVSEGLSASASYRLRLEQDAPGTVDLLLLNFSTIAGQSSNSSLVSIPNTVSGNYNIVLYRVQLATTRVGTTDVVIRTQPTVSLTPTSAAQGKSVRIQVANLSPGTVRVIFAGETVLGPIAVSGSSWTGKFIVPRDRPTTVPSTTTLVVENIIGRNVVGRTQLNFSVLAANGLPRLAATITQAPSSVVRRGATVTLGGTLRTNDGVAPVGRQSAYWRGPNGQVVPLDDDITLSSNGSFTMQARAPESFLDGMLMRGEQRGTLILQNQGFDVDSDAPATFSAQQNQAQTLEFERGFANSLPLLTIEVRKRDAANGNPLVENAIVEVLPDSRGALGAENNRSVQGAVAPLYQLDNAERAWGAMRPNQTEALRFGEVPLGRVNIPDGYGCEVTYYRKYTNANGLASFVVDLAEIAQMSVPRFVIDNLGRPHRVGGAFALDIYAAQLGLTSTQIVVGYDEDTGVWRDGEGEPFPGNRVVVLLENGNPADQFSLRNMVLDGYGGTKRSTQCSGVGEGDGTCEFIPSYFGDLYTYESTNDFPNANFVDPNALRSLRLTVPTEIFGPLSFGRIRIGNGPWSNFTAGVGTPRCTLDSLNEDQFGNSAVEYVASLDMKRMPTRKVTTSGRNASGGVDATLELKFGLQPVRSIPIKFSTIRPPNGIFAGNPAIESFQINANNDQVSGRYKVPTLDIPVASPGYGVGRLDNKSENSSVFNFVRTPDNMATQNTATTSTNKVAAVPSGPKGPSGYSAFFGFTNNNNNTPSTTTLFDTGLIPLFRYVWGLPPIAQATLGADFWTAATLKFYGELRTQGMNATIDPDVAGGVNIFFDLEALLGLVSASISAESEIGITMRSVVNGGGLAHLGQTQQSGQCFRFDLTAVWEACAVGICDGGREPLICEREPNNCVPCQSAAPKASDALGLNVSSNQPERFNALDQAKPKLVASRLGTDGRGNSITVGIDDNGDLIATHLRGTELRFTRRIAARPVAPQHLSVAFYKTDGAMVVWSANRASAASITTLMQQQGARAFDDLVRTQILFFSFWDGRVWSTPSQLTSAGSDGKMQLAGCLAPVRLAGVGSCPTGGEITAVWERDANNNLDAPDLEVWNATWSITGGWRSVGRVSSTGASGDMQPQVAYFNSTPIVVWAHNPAGQFTQLNNRQLAYRFMDGTSTQKLATALGTGVGWVSVGVSSSDQVVIGYTRTQDATSFVGNRHALFAARSILCLAGSCNFEVTEPRDQHGRQFRVERPRVSFGEDDVPIIGFRAVAYGAGSNGQVALAGDPIGIVTGTGDLGLVRVGDFTQQQYRARLLPLTNDGLQHWSPEVVFDDSIGGVLALSGRALAAQRSSLESQAAQAISGEVPVISASRELADGSVLTMMGGAPDFVLETSSASRSIISAGQTMTVRAILVNQGASYTSSTHGSVQVVAAWDAPAGAGVNAGTFTLPDPMASNASRSVAFNVTVPNDTRADERRSLFLSIVASDEANEVTGPKDEVRLDFNAMPVPQDVNAQANGSALVSIGWDASTDTRIAGWRVWKRDSAGLWRHLGSTRVAGYMDFNGVVGAVNAYRVAAYSNNGVESEPSEDTSILIEQRLDEIIFRSSFEDAPP
jgi:hypothetical protein